MKSNVALQTRLKETELKLAKLPKSVQPISKSLQKSVQASTASTKTNLGIFVCGAVLILIPIVSGIYFYDDVRGTFLEGQELAIFIVGSILSLLLGAFFVYVALFDNPTDTRTSAQKQVTIESKMSPTANRYGARRETKAAAARAERNTTLGREAVVIHQTILDTQNLVRDNTLRDVEHENTVVIYKAATARKMPIEAYKEEALWKVTVEAEVYRARELKRIETDATLLEQLNTINAILQYSNLPCNEFDEICQRYILLIEEEERIEHSHASARTKGQQLEVIEERKQAYREKMNALKNRLLETGNRSNTLGTEALNTFKRGLEVDTETSTQNAVSAIKVRGRREPSNH